MATYSPSLSLESKFYQSDQADPKIYDFWERNGVFTAHPESSKPPFSVVIPPPNVTGRLHMGHALNNIVQDAVIRFKRMDGYDCLWLPGTDHAGISTQSVMKKQLDAQGINYRDLGREGMIAKIWEWREKYGDQILLQLKRLGCSCDWTRTRFTMDERFSLAVLVAFKRLYDDGLIYRGKYIVNWCPLDRTAISDEEVITAEGGEPGHLWYIRYKLSDGSGHVTVATTRPETMLGDSAVAVNPKDKRYAHLIGKMLRLPLSDREIPIIGDDYVDPEYGTGCLKVTPAHDPNDFQIGLRHGLPQINVMNEDATIGDQAPAKYHGLDRFVCRDQVVQELNALGLLEKVEDQPVPVGRAQRSKVIIEYRLSDQWFMRMQPLAKQALDLMDRTGIGMYPERWGAVFRQWLVNTRDWCISRQIWWGHRIPAWHHIESGEILVDVETPPRVKAAPQEWRQDEDVLDTWFSSALWPYSTLGWPEKSVDLERYYPTSLLVTAKDIIYFWVARMVMTGVYFLGELPFRKVYYNAVICDANGETMSKSKGNGIDPVHVIDGATVAQLEEPVLEARPANMQETLERLRSTFPQGFKPAGADALRLTLLSLNSQAQQVQISLEKFEEVGQRFMTKLWNACKFVISGLEDVKSDAPEAEPALEDLWILGQLDACTKKVRESFEAFLFSEALQALQQFFWDDFCDWYIELVKPRLRGADAAQKKRAQHAEAEVLCGLLRLYHPIMPFITEELWQHLHKSLSTSGLIKHLPKDLTDARVCALAPYPKDEGRYSAKLAKDFALLQEMVRAIRNLRASSGIAAGAELAVLARTQAEEIKEVIEQGKSLLLSQARLKSLEFCIEKPVKMAALVLEGCELFVNLAEHLDIGAETSRNQNALKKINESIASLQQRLENPEFASRAPKHIQEAERARLQAEQEKREKLLQVLEELKQLS